MKNTKNITSNILSDNSHFILYNAANYKPSIENSVSEILTKFVDVIIQYMSLITEKIIFKNKPYYSFIFKRGLETLIHIFTVIFYYTKNLELTFYHTQKAYYFYVEFIEQTSDDNVKFLELSSRDAIIFVYRKTIYELNNEYKKNIQEPKTEEKTILETFDSYTYIYKSIVLFIINSNDLKYENKTEYINTCANSIVSISETLNKHKIKPNHIECIYLFTTLLCDNKLETAVFFELLNEFTNKIVIKKKSDDNKIIKNKIYDTEINNFINNNELNKIVDWIFSD